MREAKPDSLGVHVDDSTGIQMPRALPNEDFEALRRL